ncbi:MAG: hypothetical protein EOM62_21205 [Bacteroidia bacterium]|nr:hypothetical protein [Bacteroidia bacterium]
MKITPKDFQYLKQCVVDLVDSCKEEQLLYYAKDVKAQGKYKDFRKRILYDIFTFANRKSDFALCTYLYQKYNDDHIYTALKTLEKEIPILERMVRV